MVLLGSFSVFFFCHFRGLFWSFFWFFLLLFLVVKFSGFFWGCFSSFWGFFLVFFSGVIPPLKWAEIGKVGAKEKERGKTSGKAQQ